MIGKTTNILMGKIGFRPHSTVVPKSDGQSLPGTVRQQMEGKFGTDFSAVRVHSGTHVSGIGATSYTTGNDIHFAPGQYQPHTDKGKELLSHELTHVVQQRQATAPPTLAKSLLAI
ncbi:MAG TPA: DUF4157 domain-containing protein [Verrucomicrobiae bacterium]|jgi:hypothetical protein|nr:DUF4157 domain-containing protein [Verrucomicrobiae bacterium]